MSPEERDELIHFILQSQSNAARRHEEAMEELREHARKIEANTDQINGLAAISRDLVEVARRHPARLDRLDGINP